MRNLLLLTFLLLVSCGNNNAKNIHPTSGSLQPISTEDGKSKISIDDTSKYSKVFLDELLDSNSKEPIQLVDNKIIVGKYTTSFPCILTVDSTYTFIGVKGNHRYELRVKRMNLTTLNFNFNLYENNHLLYSNEGDAHLGTSFYLASEMDQDEQNGEGYGSFEYWKKSKDCWFSIRIGMDKDNNGKERALITYGCENQPKGSMAVNECPVMRAE